MGQGVEIVVAQRLDAKADARDARGAQDDDERGGTGGVGIGTGVSVGPGYGGELQHCERTLIFENARVVEQTWRGPEDFCSSFRRG